MARNTWYRLDNIGKFYSYQAGSSAQTVFRYSATLVDTIDQTVLQRALEKTVEIFPAFNVSLRSGMFWHYLEQASTTPVVTEENLPICFGLHVDTKSILFRVSYYRDRINFEVSHIVSDGRGSLSFFKTLLYAYLQERYSIADMSLAYDGSDNQKVEDSYDKHFEPAKAASTPKQKVYRLSGWHDTADPTFVEYHLPTQKVRELARSYEVSVTALIIGVLIYSIRKEMSRRDRGRTIRITVPVDLRQIFDSTTTKNFFGLAFVSYTSQDNEPVQGICMKVDAQIKSATEPENLKPRMNQMISLEKNIFLRFAPLFMKDAGLRFAAWRSARETTTTVSSLGKIQLDKKVAPFVRDLNIMTSTSGFNLAFCSYENDLSITFSTIYSNLDVVKNFCRYFSEQDIHGLVNINKTNEEVAADYREARIEASMKRISGQRPPHEEASVNARNKEEADHENLS